MEKKVLWNEKETAENKRNMKETAVQTERKSERAAK